MYLSVLWKADLIVQTIPLIMSLVSVYGLEIVQLATLEECVTKYAATTVAMVVSDSRASLKMVELWGNLENFAMNLVILDRKFVVIKIPEIVSVNRT